MLEPETLKPALEGADDRLLPRPLDGARGRRRLRAARPRRRRQLRHGRREAGVERLVYLGGLGDETTSKHLRSRHKTAEALQESGLPVTYFRAAAVLGAGSESFRTVYYLVKRLPFMLAPSWTENRTQPIAIADVLAYLRAAASVEAATGRTIEIGGPEVTTYAGMMDSMADAIGIRRRPRISVPVLSPTLSSHWIGLVTPVDAGVAKPLVEGLATDTVVEDPVGDGAVRDRADSRRGRDARRRREPKPSRGLRLSGLEAAPSRPAPPPRAASRPSTPAGRGWRASAGTRA